VGEAECVRRYVCACGERNLSRFGNVPVEEEKSCPFPEVGLPLWQRSEMRSGLPSYNFSKPQHLSDTRHRTKKSKERT